MGSKHGIISSKTCAEATTCAARWFLKRMIATTNKNGYKVFYGDTDSIFVHVKAKTEDECMAIGKALKKKIDESMMGTPFAKVGAGIDGNYKSVLITSRKKYAMVHWNGDIETKGMAPVKKDVLPIARYAANKVLPIVTSGISSQDKMVACRNFLGKLFTALGDNKLPLNMQVAEVKVNCQPHRGLGCEQEVGQREGHGSHREHPRCGRFAQRQVHDVLVRAGDEVEEEVGDDCVGVLVHGHRLVHIVGHVHAHGRKLGLPRAPVHNPERCHLYAVDCPVEAVAGLESGSWTESMTADAVLADLDDVEYAGGRVYDTKNGLEVACATSPTQAYGHACLAAVGRTHAEGQGRRLVLALIAARVALEVVVIIVGMAVSAMLVRLVRNVTTGIRDDVGEAGHVSVVVVTRLRFCGGGVSLRPLRHFPALAG
ncbi:hypothetical protein IFR05_017163, partial [Cadophora sp. M221]